MHNHSNGNELRIVIQIKLISLTIVEHQDSLWNRDKRQLWNGLLEKKLNKYKELVDKQSSNHNSRTHALSISFFVCVGQGRLFPYDYVFRVASYKGAWTSISIVHKMKHLFRSLKCGNLNSNNKSGTSENFLLLSLRYCSFLHICSTLNDPFKVPQGNDYWTLLIKVSLT